MLNREIYGPPAQELINRVKMALQTAKICKEKVKKRVFCTDETFDKVRLQRVERPLFCRVPEPENRSFSVSHRRAALFLVTLASYGQFARLMRYKPLKIIWFPAYLRLLSEQIISYHFNPICESMTQGDTI